MVASRSESKETHYQYNLKITSHRVEDSHCGPLKSTTFLSRLAFTSTKSFKESNITALDVVTSYTAIVTCQLCFPGTSISDMKRKKNSTKGGLQNMNFIQSKFINDAIFRRNKSPLVDLPDNYSLIPILVDCGGWSMSFFQAHLLLPKASYQFLSNFAQKSGLAMWLKISKV